MDEPLKRRLIGATVLVSLAIIFLPMLLSHEPVARHQGKMPPIPNEPKREFDPGLLQETTPEQPKPAAAKVAPEKPLAPAKPAAPKPAPKPVSRPKTRAVAPPHVPDPGRKPVTPAAKGSPQAWVIRVGSFSSLASADKLVRKLRKAGLDTMNPVPVTVKGKRYYRVQVGPQLDRKRTDRLLPRVNRITGTKGQVVRYP
ncbi:SPOR domain-containing protein [Thiolapillus brandeum]|uniref:SPOR domain-containing protein n=1 Tax=Thiolapillus brandeum TaxID=1076588 RepID=UPI0011861794|nr:SPOR domain-containing protein [Thiolapillus brandeum]